MRSVRVFLSALSATALCAAPTGVLPQPAAAWATPDNPCPTERIDDRGDEPWDSLNDDPREGERVYLLALFQAAYPNAVITREKLLITAYGPYYAKTSQPTVGGWGRIQKRSNDKLRDVGFTPAGAQRVSNGDVAGWVEFAAPAKNAPADAQACESRPIVLAMIDGAAYRKAHRYDGDFDGDMYGYFEIKR